MREHRLPVWQVRILAELGLLDTTADSDPTRFHQARELATAAGMAGMVARIDLWIAEIIGTRSGWVAAYPVVVRADAQARLLQLNGLSAAARAHLAQCLVHAEDHPLPGRMGQSAASEVDDLIAQALTLGQTSQPVPWAKAVLGIRAWFQGDDATAIQLFDEALRFMRTEVKVMPLPGVGALLRVVAGTHPEEAFGPPELLGHHCNWAARAYGNAVQDLRKGRSGTESIGEAEEKVRHTPFMRHCCARSLCRLSLEEGAG